MKTASQPHYSREETARRGQQRYEQDIRSTVEAAHSGEFAAIDIETGTYELDKDDYLATEKLLARQPDAQIWLVRVRPRHDLPDRWSSLLSETGTCMIVGIVNSYHEATIPLLVQSVSAQEQQIEFILDTGFSGSLTLPPALISALGLPFRSRGSAILADGSEAQFDVHVAAVIWDGIPRTLLIEAADTDPLVGMGLLYGFNINIQAVDGGAVKIERLAPFA